MMNTLDPASRVALVTGGMGGIGRGIALALAARGFDVVLADRQIDAARADELRAQIPPLELQSRSTAACISTITNTDRTYLQDR
ncbi:NAD(P)-dependent dehydrogenase (short-subunit alcohol dehydrogenase family) [Paraburkholderia sp. GAS448]|jgi:NAD(P)-dependent dehydrogenase (short-subunit alcohol dehydrogenase family)|uniref:SDR family NAD(P)-dependent oxidoreductase n=1 Tax=Paraburkholderia sp. GAS448 TaxID=3035136 RepID=UPI003D23FA5C